MATQAPQALIPKQDIKKPSKPKAAKVKTWEKPKAPSNTDVKGVYQVRYGAHAYKTRLVFDVNGPTNHTMNYDAEAGIITITMPNTLWNAEKSKTYNKSQILGYEAKAINGGTIIAMAVQNTRSVKIDTLSKPNRLVIDLMK